MVGELWTGRGEFQEIISICRRKIPDTRWERVGFHVYDLPSSSEFFKPRSWRVRKDQFFIDFFMVFCSKIKHTL